MVPRDIKESDFLKIGFFKNAWFVTCSILLVISIICGLLLIVIVYQTSELKFDPINFGLDDEDFEKY